MPLMPSRCTSRVDDVAAEGERGEDGGLGRGVVAVHVGRRVALGQPESLGLAQDVVVAVALLLHAGEDVVGRAVDDPHDTHDLLARQRLAQRPDHRDGAGHRRLVEQVHAGGGGDFGQLGAGDGQQRLVARDDRLAVAQRRLDELVGRVQAADQLDHDVDVVPRHQGGGVGADEPASMAGAPGLLRVGHGDADQLQADARAGGDVVGAGEEDLGQRAADVAAAEQARPGRSGPGARARWGGVGRGHRQTCAGPVGGHLQTVQAARAAAEWCYHHAAPAGWLP